jgi:hypothetical protein
MAHKPPLGPDGKTARCHYCERILEATTSRSVLRATEDHVVPQWCGGRRTVWACWFCNHLKDAFLPSEFYAYIKANPLYWKR